MDPTEPRTPIPNSQIISESQGAIKRKEQEGDLLNKSPSPKPKRPSKKIINIQPKKSNSLPNRPIQIAPSQNIINVYPKKPSASLAKPAQPSRPAVIIPQLTETCIQDYRTVLNLASYYSLELERLGRCPCLVDYNANRVIPDSKWMAQRNQLIVSCIACLETCIQFIYALKSSPGVMVLNHLDFPALELEEIKVKTKLSSILLNYTTNYLKAEKMLIDTLPLSQKHYFPKNYSLGVRVQLAKLYLHLKQYKPAISELKNILQNAIELGYADWAYTAAFELVNAYKTIGDSTMMFKELNKVVSLAGENGHSKIWALVVFKLVEGHLWLREIKTIAAVLPTYEEHFFSYKFQSNLIDQPAFYTQFLVLKGLYLLHAGEIDAAGKILAKADDALKAWNEQSAGSHVVQINFKPGVHRDTSHSQEMVSTLRVEWLSINQIAALITHLRGFSVKGDPQAINPHTVNLNPRFLPLAINSFESSAFQPKMPILKHIPATGTTQISQLWNLNALISAKLDQSEYDISQEKFQAAYDGMIEASKLVVSNKMWDRYKLRLILVRAMIHQSLRRIDLAALSCKAILKLSDDKEYKLQALFMQLSLEMPEGKFDKPRLLRVIENIKSKSPAPRTPLVESRLCFYIGCIAEETLDKKNLYKRALQLAKLTSNASLNRALNLATASLFLNTEPRAAEGLLKRCLNGLSPGSYSLSCIVALYFLKTLYHHSNRHDDFNALDEPIQTYVAHYQNSYRIV